MVFLGELHKVMHVRVMESKTLTYRENHLCLIARSGVHQRCEPRPPPIHAPAVYPYILDQLYFFKNELSVHTAKYYSPVR